MTAKVMSRVCSFSRRFLLATSTLWGAAAVAAPGVRMRERQERRLVLSELRPGEVPRVRVAPGVSTLLLFDAELGAVSLEERGRFARVEVAGRALVLRPAEALEVGERLRLEVTFADGLAPARAVFALVTDPERVDGEVEVERRPRTAEELQLELDALRARCGASALAQLALWGRLGRESLRSGAFTGRYSARGLEVKPPWVHRTSARRVLLIQVRNPQGAAPWAPGEALLWGMGEAAEPRSVPVYLDAFRLEPGDGGLVVVEIETGAASRWRLEVREKGGERSIELVEGR
jgi:uncharacterized protein (TIGR02268 family)